MLVLDELRRFIERIGAFVHAHDFPAISDVRAGAAAGRSVYLRTCAGGENGKSG
jgi:hypothetical protein